MFRKAVPCYNIAISWYALPSFASQLVFRSLISSLYSSNFVFSLSFASDDLLLEDFLGGSGSTYVNGYTSCTAQRNAKFLKGDEHKLWHFSLCNFLYFCYFIFSDSNIFFSTVFSSKQCQSTTSESPNFALIHQSTTFYRTDHHIIVVVI